jgi:hypothetical protein
MIADAVTYHASGNFGNLDDALKVAASALNYIMDQVEEPDDNESN